MADVHVGNDMTLKILLLMMLVGSIAAGSHIQGFIASRNRRAG